LLEARLQGAVDLGVSYFRVNSLEFRNRLLMGESLVPMVQQDHPAVAAQ